MRTIGEGALAGLVAGAALGGWDVRLSDDIAHGTWWLAVHRLAGPILVSALCGLAISALASLAFGASYRWGNRGRIAVMAAIAAIALASAIAAAGPWKDNAFPLTRFSSSKLSAAMIGTVLGTGFCLLARRTADAFGLRVGSRLGSILAPIGGSGLLLAFAAWLSLPMISASRAEGHPSVILVSIDTLRADRLGRLRSASRPSLSGSESTALPSSGSRSNEPQSWIPPSTDSAAAAGEGPTQSSTAPTSILPRRSLTPRLDALAREGMVFEQAVSASPWTLPSHVSLFTSMLPFDHHVRWSRSYIDPIRSMLAERFRDAGYRTAAFTGGAYVSSHYGFDQGFEVYEDHDEEKEGGPEKLAAAALAWALGARGAPFFLFVHTYEVHSPYSHVDLANPAESGRLGIVFSNEDVEQTHSGKLLLTPAERSYVTDLYDGDVAHADTVIGGLLETLKAEGILDHAILVILSDHGEDLWDHDDLWSPGHGHSLYQELIHVPLIFRASGIVKEGARVRAPVSLLDVAPTLLALSGLPPESDHRGRSLAATLRTGIEPRSVPVYSESVEYGPDRFALREGDRKMIRTPFPDRVHNHVHFDVRPIEIFDLSSDPEERHDLSSSIESPGDRRTEGAEPGASRGSEPAKRGGASASAASWAPIAKRDARMALALGRRAEKALHAPDPALTSPTRVPQPLLEQLRSLGYVQ